METLHTTARAASICGASCKGGQAPRYESSFYDGPKPTVLNIRLKYRLSYKRYVGLRIEMYAFLRRLELPDKPSSAEFEAAKRVITSDIIMCRSLREVGNSLNTVYAKYPP